MNKHKVFVYGTLRKNERNHCLLNGAKQLAEQAWTNGILYNTGKGYPAVQHYSEGLVYGELYEVTDTELASLDQLEGYEQGSKHNLYDRITQTVYTDKRAHEAFVYIYVNSEMLHEKIVSGDWKEYNLRKQSIVYYYAYGSCMDHERFKIANVDHFFQKVTGKGVLEGYSLRFTVRLPDGGRADIVEEGGEVEGIVYELDADALHYLYKREGVNESLYRPAVVQVKMADNAYKEVLTFIVVNKEDETAPPAHYLTEILRGGKDILSKGYLKRLEERFPNVLV